MGGSAASDRVWTVLTPRRSRYARRALLALAILAIGIPALWIAIHEVSGFGPAVADGARALFGPRAVAWAEDTSYGIQDRINRWRYKDTKPTTFWTAPTGTIPAPIASAALPAAAVETDAGLPVARSVPFPPPSYAPPLPNVAAPGDGTWISVEDATRPAASPVMAKSVVHPDAKRGYAAVAVVAVDLEHADVHLVAGTQEPASDRIPADHRPGTIPTQDRAALIAAFNGGFKAIHGHWGMMLGGEVFVAPRDIGCTIALNRDGSMKIRSWSKLKADESLMAGYRQTPPCLVEGGKINTVLEGGEYSKNWGATVSGETVIRRSAIGIDRSERVLFYGLGEAVTAEALSRAMRAVGAENAAQLDVNYSFPRFLFFDHTPSDDAPRVRESLIPGIKFTKNEYVVQPELRDFFYLTRRNPAS